MKSREFNSLAGNAYLRISVIFTILFLVAFLVMIFVKGGKVLNFSFLTQFPKEGMTKGGIFPAIVGTLYLTLISVAIALPFGVLAAVFLVEYAQPKWLVDIINMAINTLAGVPSIVFGLFGLAFFVNSLGFGASLIAGSLTLSILLLPIIINTTVEAIRSIPRDFREGAYALGATKRQMILKVIIPAAIPNIMTGAIISVGRAAGETAPILFTSATYYSRFLPKSLSDEVMALPYHIYALMTEGTKPEFLVPIAYGTAIVLLGLVLAVNLVAILIRFNIREKKNMVAENNVIKEEILVHGLKLWFGDNQVLKGISLPIHAKQVTAVIGPSGCGKSTLLRCFNRMHDLVPHARTEGSIFMDKEDILMKNIDIYALRMRVGMVFQKPNPFPKSIYENISFGLQLKGMRKRSEIMERVEKCLKDAWIWDEVKDRLNKSAMELSGGQQQRLCIARALANKPEILLLDEPTSALDPQSTSKIEELLLELKKDVTIAIVTHNIGQAGRVSDYTAFLYLGELVEFGTTESLFTVPRDKRTESYLTGKFG